MFIRQNPHRYSTPNGWNEIAKAPKDGTVIEVQNNWGVAPSFSLARWKDGRGWVDATREDSGLIDGLHLSWRPHAGAVASYADPTGGAQNTRAYWLRAAGFNPAHYGAKDGVSWDDE